MPKWWPGKRDDMTEVGPLPGEGGVGYDVLQNVSFYKAGELTERPGLGTRTTIQGVTLSDIYDAQDGQFILAASSAGTIDSAQPGDSSHTQLKSGLASGLIPDTAKSNGRVYWANGFDDVQAVENGTSSAQTVGIEAPGSALGAPSQAAGSNTTAGDHLMRYRYYNSKSGYYSDPSDAITVTVTAAGTDGELTFTIGTSGTDIIRSTDSKVDQVIVEMTVADGTVYYFAEYVNQSESSVVIDISDTALSQRSIASGDSDGFGNEPPPAFDILAAHRGRLFGLTTKPYTITGASVTSGSATVTGSGFSTNWAGRLLRVAGSSTTYRIASVASSSSLTLSENYAGSSDASATFTVFPSAPDLLYWSAPGLPESWRASRRARRVMLDESDIPTALVPYYGDLLIFGRRSMRRLVYVADPATSELIRSDSAYGVYNPRCAVFANGTLYGFGPSGIWAMNGTLPTHISKPVGETIEGLRDGSQADAYHVAFDPDERVLLFFFVRTGDSAPRDAACLDIDNGRWSMRTWRHGITASATIADDNGDLALWLSDDNAYTWEVVRERWDGVDEGATAATTVAAGSTASSINVADTIQADADGLIAYSPSLDEERTVSSNTTSSVTLSSAFSSTPATGSALYLGSIPVEVKPKRERAGKGRLHKSRPHALGVEWVPQDAGSMDVEVRADYSDAAEGFTKADASMYRPPKGISIGSNNQSVDLSIADGQASVPLLSEWHRHLQWRITKTSTAGRLRLLDCFWQITPEGTQEVSRE